eukprot:scaffold27690_cov63-Phaeocystis_antarctica.AAC.6
MFTAASCSAAWAVSATASASAASLSAFSRASFGQTHVTLSAMSSCCISLTPRTPASARR